MSTISNDYNKYAVRLIPVSSLLTATSVTRANQVIFDVTPTFSESGDVMYETIQPIHMPGGIQVYKSTSSRRFTIGAILISRNSREASNNMRMLQLLRGWRYPYFGASANTSVQTAATPVNGATPTSPSSQIANAQSRIGAASINMLGAPPDVLYLYAYSSDVNSSTSSNRQVSVGVNINRVPVVMSGLEISYPPDVDYIPTFSNISSRGEVVDETSEPFPVKMEVTVNLTETHSPSEYENFSLAAYKRGQLTNF